MSADALLHPSFSKPCDAAGERAFQPVRCLCESGSSESAPMGGPLMDRFLAAVFDRRPLLPAVGVPRGQTCALRRARRGPGGRPPVSHPGTERVISTTTTDCLICVRLRPTDPIRQAT
jgi:hypothetical protein